MENNLSQVLLDLPTIWDKRIKSKKLKEMIAEEGMWLGRDLPTSKKGHEILSINAPLFGFCELLDDFDYALEPVEGCLFELLPGSVYRQGAGISVDLQRKSLELDVYFFPCDYTEDENRDLPFMYVRNPVVTVFDSKMLVSFVRKYFPGDERSVIIPFSLERVAELEGNFMDKYRSTEKICRKVVEGGTDQEIKNCERFLEFIRTAGLSQ